MVSIEQFRKWMDEILEELPAEFFEELNGGVLLSEEIKFHPESVGTELVVLGEYRRDMVLGKYIVIFYGSYEQMYGYLEEEALQKRLRKTILHEFRHHLEWRAGDKSLEIEDKIDIEKYKRKR